MKCSTCRTKEARPGQRSCHGCHRIYMRGQRARQTLDLLRMKAELAALKNVPCRTVTSVTANSIPATQNCGIRGSGISEKFAVQSGPRNQETVTPNER